MTPDDVTRALAAADQAQARRRSRRFARTVCLALLALVLFGALVMILSACAAMSPRPAVYPSPTPYPGMTR